MADPRRRGRGLAGIAAGVIVALSAASTATAVATADTRPANTAAATHQVPIVDYTFSPQEIVVGIGDTVVWTNRDSVAHDVRAEDESFASDLLETGDTFRVTFDSEGRFPYVCTLHSGMAGVVVVSADAPAPDPIANLLGPLLGG